MTKITYEPTITLNEKTLAILTNREKNQGCFVEILDAIDEQMAAMLSHHHQIMIVRLDLFPAGYTPTNKVMSDFLKALKRRLPKIYQRHNKLGFVWAREHNISSKQHYHLALFMNADSIRNEHALLNLCREIWNRLGHPTLNLSENAKFYVRRNDHREYESAFLRLSYLAKIYSKSKRPPKTNRFGKSHLKPRN